MKKSILCISLILILAVFLCSCGKNQQFSSEPSVTTLPQETQAHSTFESSNTETSSVDESFKEENFVKDGQFINYVENGQKKTIQGIDVSEYNTDIDFQTVKNEGIDFVMVRLGGRGYGDSGALYPDKKALEYIESAKSAGLKVGGYFFSQAINEREAEEEAEYVISLLEDLTLDMPIGFDWETIKDDTARTDNLDNQSLTDCAAAFCRKINATGKYSSIIYAKADVLSRYNKKDLADCDFWLSEYADKPSVLEGYSMWQYSETAEINGVGTTDLNLCFLN